MKYVLTEMTPKVKVFSTNASKKRKHFIKQVTVILLLFSIFAFLSLYAAGGIGMNA